MLEGVEVAGDVLVSVDEHRIYIAEVVGVSLGLTGQEPVGDDGRDRLAEGDPDVSLVFVLKTAVALLAAEQGGQTGVSAKDVDEIPGVGRLDATALGTVELVENLDLCTESADA